MGDATTPITDDEFKAAAEHERALATVHVLARLKAEGDTGFGGGGPVVLFAGMAAALASLVVSIPNLSELQLRVLAQGQFRECLDEAFAHLAARRRVN